jgi:hypothetical protein
MFFQNWHRGRGYHLFDLVCVEFIGDLVEDAHLLLVLLEGEGLLLNVEALVDASLAEDVLLDGPVDHKAVESALVGGGGGLPLGGRHDLRDIKIGKRPGLLLVKKGLPSPFHSFFYKVYPIFRRITKNS